MDQKDINLLDTLNLLTLLFRANQQKVPKLSEEEQHTLTVTKEHLDGAKIPIPVFLNTLKTLSDKGYLTALGVFENEYHQEIRNVFEEKQYSQIISKISDNGLNELSEAQKTALADGIEKMLPPGTNFDRKGFIQEGVTLKDILDDSRKVLKDHKDEDVAVVILFPFRDINTLLEKMNLGQSLSQIQDSGVWYDSVKYEFHIGDEIIPVSYQGKPNVEHFVLEKLNDCLADGLIGFEDITAHTPSSLRHSLLRFVEKDERLRSIFKVHSDRLAFDKEAF